MYFFYASGVKFNTLPYRFKIDNVKANTNKVMRFHFYCQILLTSFFETFHISICILFECSVEKLT